MCMEYYMEPGHTIPEIYPKMPSLDDIVNHAIQGECYDGKGGWVKPEERGLRIFDRRSEIDRCVQKSFEALGCSFQKDFFQQYYLEAVNFSVCTYYRNKIKKEGDHEIKCNDHEFHEKDIGKDTLDLLTRVNEMILSMDDTICKINTNKEFIAPEILYSDRQFILEAIKRDKETYGNIALENLKQHGDNSLLSSRNFMLKVLKLNSYLIKFAEENLKKDKTFMIEAISIDPDIFKYGDPSLLKEDKEFIQTFCSLHTDALNFLDKSVLTKDILNTAFETNGMQLKILFKHYGFTSVDLVMTAVRQNGLALQYADQKCRSNEKIVLTAIKQNLKALEYVSPTLKNEDKFYIDCMKDKDLTPDQKKEILSLIKDTKTDLYQRLMK